HVAMKPRAPQAQSVVRGKQSRYAHCAFLESNAVEAVTACLLEIDSNRRRSRDSVGHDAFPTRLIDRWGGAIRHYHIKSAAPRGDRGCQSRRPSADDEDFGTARQSHAVVLLTVTGLCIGPVSEPIVNTEFTG